jgi:hypothetical protein
MNIVLDELKKFPNLNQIVFRSMFFEHNYLLSINQENTPNKWELINTQEFIKYYKLIKSHKITKDSKVLTNPNTNYHCIQKLYNEYILFS